MMMVSENPLLSIRERSWVPIAASCEAEMEQVGYVVSLFWGSFWMPMAYTLKPRLW